MEIPALLVILVHLEVKDLLDMRVQLEPPVREDHQVTRDQTENKERMEVQVLLDHLDHL